MLAANWRQVGFDVAEQPLSPTQIVDAQTRATQPTMYLNAASAAEVQQTAAEMKTRARFAKIDTEAAPGIAGRYGIRSIPTLILFKQGKEAARVSGAMDARSIQNWVNQAL